jgi:phosphatidylserine/phosphatidylglycerophosphate/cardiolipin synthase-like enzyme
MLLKAGETCWRTAPATRGALIIDMADYFLAAREAFLKARSTIHLLNWAFDPDTLFEPKAGVTPSDDDRFGPFLRRLAFERPELDVRILCWKSALPIAATQRFFPHRAKKCFEGSPVRFLLDATVPLGACHHQKMIVIDDRLAFCGGGDIGPDRWDTALHLDDDPRRLKPGSAHAYYHSRHETMGLVEGPPAAALSELFRERWRRATGEDPPCAGPAEDDLWPAAIKPEFRDVATGISRSAPDWPSDGEVRENEALHLAAIHAARRCIYLENQYFTSPLVAEALAMRLAEPGGPEVVLVSAERSPSWFDHVTMDRTRSLFLKRLREADAFRRLYAYVPLTLAGRGMIVHAKLSIIDDTLLRIGSANLNNRSGGFDTECDLSFEADAADKRTGAAIAAARARLVSHALGCSARILEQAITEAGGLGAAIERLRARGFDRLKPLSPSPLGPLAAFIASHHLGDPVEVADSWRPWRRRASLEARRRRLAEIFAREPDDFAAARAARPHRAKPARLSA